VATRSRRDLVRALVGVTAATLTLTFVPTMSSTAEPTPTLGEVTRQVDALNEQASQANEDYLEARIDAGDAQRRMSAVQGRITREERNLAVVRKDIGALASMAYRNGGLDSSLELLLSDDPAEFLNRSASLDQVSRGQGASLRKAQVSQQRLAQDKLALAQELGGLKEAQSKATAAKTSIDERAAKAKALLARLTAADRARYDAARAARAASALRASRDALRTLDTTPDRSRSRSSSSSSDGGGFTGGGVGSGRAAAAVAWAKQQVGDRYVWGAAGPNAFDCSGLTSQAWRAAGVSLPQQSRAQYAATDRVSKSQLRPGDLVFFYSPISHVGIYIGGGLMVHAANPREGVEVASISSYYGRVFAGGGRV